jgi:D-beta-D-heptose 7-phosphate kinase/D-beta-D-heptose 1-phosphate adenosyltransferase
MNSDLLGLIDAFAGLRVLVIGDAILDTYLQGATGRFCKEAPVPVVDLTERSDVPGGAANTAVNVAGMGARVRLFAATGADTEGHRLRRVLADHGVAAGDVLACPGRRTLAKHRIMAASQILLRYDQGATASVPAATEATLIERLAEAYPQADAVIVSDYGYGVLTPRVIRALADLQARWARVLVVDAKRRLAGFRGVGATAVKPNYEEAVGLLDAGALDGYRDRADAVAAHASALLDRAGAPVVVVTLDHDGALVLEHGRPPYRVTTRARQTSCVAGAGDTFAGALALALAAGAPAPMAAELAAAAAAVVVAKAGTATCAAQELRDYVAGAGKYVADPVRLAERLARARRQGRRVVFTNGCFDILHRGHVTYLNRARTLGDLLVLGVNRDETIRRLKGPGRPINTLEDRVQVLAALSCVDHITAFAEDTPCELIRHLRPEVFVKGGDYTRERLPEAPLVEALGGVVHILPYLEERSTTGIIQRIRAEPGGRPAAREAAG